MENQLVAIVNESGLDKTKAEIILERFNDSFLLASEWEKKAKVLVVTDVNQKAEMKMAREGRLFLKNKRIWIEKTRKELKEQSLREGKAIDGIANVLKALIEPIEDYLEKQEKFAEIKEKEAKEILKQEREKELSPYLVLLPDNIDISNIANISEEEYQELLINYKKFAEYKIQEQKRIEEERLARIKAEEEEKARILAENEKLKKEREIERLKAEEEKKILEEKNRIEKEKQEAILKKEQEKRELLEKELKKKEQEEKKKIEEEKKKIEEEKKRLETEKMMKEELAKQPDKEKIKNYIESIFDIPIPDITDKELISKYLDFKRELNYICEKFKHDYLN